MKKILTKTFTAFIALMMLFSIAGWAQETQIYATGFEAAEGFTAGTVYNNTTVKLDGPVGEQWGTYYGTASTTSPLAGSMSMQMRWYTTTTANLGYTFTDFDLHNVTKVTFFAANTLGLKVAASYSIDGGVTFINPEVFSITGTSAEYTYNISATGEFANVRIRFDIVLPEPIPTGTSRLYIDNVAVFGIPSGNEPPVISNVTISPEDIILSTDPVGVTADIVDAEGTVEVTKVLWGTLITELVNEINMTIPPKATYAAQIPAQADGTTVFYRIYAEDNEGAFSQSSIQSYKVRDPETTALPYEETFDTNIDGVFTYSVSGDTKHWGFGTFSGNGYAVMNGFGSTELEEDWLILPGVNVTSYENVILNFETSYNFGVDNEDNYLKLFYSTDYFGVGDPSTATWVEIPFAKPLEGNYVWTASGDIHLSGIEVGIGEDLYIGFKYNYASDYRRWQIDNINIFEQAPETFTVYFNNAFNWEQVYVFSWVGGLKELGDWPGELMTAPAEGSPWYSYEIPVGNNKVIFNNGDGGIGNQTADLDRSYAGYYNGMVWFDEEPTLANLELNVNMALWAARGDFNPANGDFIEVAGEFNVWGEFQIIASDPDEDMIYTANIDDVVVVGESYEFKFRINNAGWGSPWWEEDPNRSVTIIDGQNIVLDWFNRVVPVSAQINPAELFMYDNWPTEDGEIIITWNEGFEVTDFSYFDEDLADYVSLLPLYGPRETGGLWEIFDIDGLTASLVIYWENAPNGDPKSKENDLLVDLINLKLDFLLGDPAYIDLSILMKTFNITFAVEDELGDPVPTANIIFEPWNGGINGGGNIVLDENPVFEVFASYDYMYTIEALGYNTVIGYIEGVAEDMIVDIVLEEVVSATIDPTSFDILVNWDNDNPEFLITWNDASSVTGMSFYDDSEALWIPLPEAMWTVINDDGLTATLIIDLDESPAKGNKEGEYFLNQITWRVEFNVGEPAIGHTNMFVKTFLVAVIAYDEAFTPIPTYTVELTPYYDGGNPGQIWDDTNNPSFEVWARGDYQYVVTAEGYFPAEGTILNVEADMPVDVLLTKMENEIIAVATIADITVDFGTEIIDVTLPSSVEVTLENAEIINLEVVWDGGTPLYDGFTAGTYAFEGTLTLIEGVVNTAGHTATVNVVVNPEKEIVSVETLMDIQVFVGTDVLDIGLPAAVEVTLDDASIIELAVTWDGGTPVYDGSVAGTYVFEGTINLITGVINSADHKAVIDVIVFEDEKIIASVETLDDITVYYGTDIMDVNLPASVEVTTTDLYVVNLDVIWDAGTPVYDGTTPDTYYFTGQLQLIAGYINPNDVIAEINVIVVNKEITAVAEIADISVEYGTIIGDVMLPATVEVTLDDESTIDLDVVWDGGTPAYDGNIAGTYAFVGTITLIDGIDNTAALTASANVIVEEEVIPDKEIVAVAAIADITVALGTVIGDLVLPATVEVTLDDDSTMDLDVAWDGGTPAFDGDVAGTYAFEGILTLVDGIANTAAYTAAVNVIVEDQDEFVIDTFPWTEGFEVTVPPTHWNQYILGDEGDNIWTVSSIANTGVQAAFHRYTAVTVDADNWLVTPKIILPVADKSALQLSFFERNQFMSYYTYSGVWISTGSGNPADGDFVEVYEANTAAANYTIRTMNLGDFAGQEIYIAFVYQGIDGHSWWVDDVTIQETPSYTVNYSVVGGNGSISATANGSAIDSGDSAEAASVIVFTAIPDSGYRVKEWAVNGTVVTSYTELTYTIPSLIADVNVTVEFEVEPAGAEFMLSWDVAPTATTPTYRAEHYSVWVSTTGTDVADFTMVYEETISTTHTNWEYQNRQVNITDYDGMNIYVAFRHHDVTDMDRIVIDNIEILMIDEESNEMIVFFEDFQEGVDNEEGEEWLPDGWLAIDADGDDFGWYFGIREGNGAMRSQSWDATAGALTPDNWLITPSILLVEPVIEYFTVTFSVDGGNGTIAATVGATAIDSGDEVEEGSNVVFTATPDTDYVVKAWYLDGAVVDGETGTTYTYANLDADIDVKVEFEYGNFIPGIDVTEVNVFPNPARTNTTIVSESMITEIIIVGVLGEVVYEQVVGDFTYNLNVTNFRSGLYFIRVVTENGIVTKRLLVN